MAKNIINLSEKDNKALARITVIAAINDIKVTNNENTIKLGLDWLSTLLHELDEESLINILNLKKSI